ncbi:uncharacterized protein LOC127265999 [Andrographis paniculata]|uniref:uncharacterized protein LOC127265999 n=1 Tax=Andrographis paniculata TaxID=175694 RepID=UPI0021E730C9|nr:uncharacterized protein LOC127265999 [Andrographis paniculata]
MENGERNLESRFAGMTVGDPYSINGNDGLFQVMKAVEAAEATIKQQVDENNRLKAELQQRIEELERYKAGDAKYSNPQLGDRWGDHVLESSRADQIVLHSANQARGVGKADINSEHMLQTNTMRSNEDHVKQTQVENQFESGKLSGSSNITHSGQVAADNSVVSQFVSPSIAVFSPGRYPQDADLESEFKYSGRGSTSLAEVNNVGSSKQDIVVKVREHEEEILQLKRHLSELAIKEAQIRNEKNALEKRISYMRMAFDQQQQDLVLAASKAISYRQDIMEENVRLTYALQAAQQERSTFVTSLMPLLAEYSLQPADANAQSIVSNVKVLFRHLQEQLLVIEGKLKESQYQLAPWRSESNPSNFSQSPVYPVEMKNGLELVPQPTYTDGKMPSSDPQTANAGDIVGLPQSGMDNFKNSEYNELGKRPPPASRNMAPHDVSSQLAFNQSDPYAAGASEGTVSKKVTFGDLVKSNDISEPENRGHQSDRDPSANWNSKASATTMDDPVTSYSPFLPPVLEEPSSSVSEAAEDDPLPAIEDLQISGEAYPGQQLQAAGYSINGTTSCNFEWVRHLGDGSFNYVDGAKQPYYLVSADDVDTYLAIEVQPLDNRKRKGDLVTVFANERRKISCDSEMHSCIEKTLYAGHASYKLSLPAGYLDLWEPAILSIKRDGYSIKGSGPSGVSISKKFTSSTNVSITYGNATDFSIADSMGEDEHILRVDSNSTDVSCARDTIVLTLRLFIIKASEKKKGKKRGLFFHK